VKLAIVDVGCGNIGSVGIAFERFGLDPLVTSDAGQIASADRVVLPGVGAAGFAMEQIGKRGLAGPLKALKQPLLGICLGMQLLFEGSEEENVACLGIFEGRVRKLDPKPGMPVPHMGWSRLAVSDGGAGLRDGDYVYFAHSYACDVETNTAATANHGRCIAAAVRHENWTGVQFHPERSGAAGQRLLERFLA